MALQRSIVIESFAISSSRASWHYRVGGGYELMHIDFLLARLAILCGGWSLMQGVDRLGRIFFRRRVSIAQVRDRGLTVILTPTGCDAGLRL
jgi:hypothetical protein